MPQPNPTQAAPLSKRAIFVRRLSSTVVLWSIVLTAMFSANRDLSDFVFVAILMLLAGSGLWEFYAMAQKRGMACFKGWGMFGGLLLIGSTFLWLSQRLGPVLQPSKANDFETAYLVLFVLGLCVKQFSSTRSPDGLQAISTTLFGLMYVPWLLNFIQKINYFPNMDGGGRFYVLYFIVVTKFSDVGAYAVGSMIGRHKMIPRISPGKTWEGFGGAIVVSTGASVLFAHLGGSHLKGMTLTHALILGLILSIAAVIGDLIESLFKREAQVKDSGNLFPGIGGILDLLDRLLFNAPLMYLYLRHVLTHP